MAVLGLEVRGQALDLDVHELIGPEEDLIRCLAVIAGADFELAPERRVRIRAELLGQLELAAVAQ